MTAKGMRFAPLVIGLLASIASADQLAEPCQHGQEALTAFAFSGHEEAREYLGEGDCLSESPCDCEEADIECLHRLRHAESAKPCGILIQIGVGQTELDDWRTAETPADAWGGISLGWPGQAAEAFATR